MSKTFYTTLDVTPMPTPRPRARAIPTRGRTIVSMYHPKEYTTYKARLAELLAKAFVGEEPFCGALRAQICIECKRPKTTKLIAPRPDADNYGKAVLDAATDAGLWADDTQVVDLRVTKSWGLTDSIYLEIAPA